MLRIISKALRTGRVTYTAKALELADPPTTKGRPALDPAQCDGNAACEAVCPTSAISLGTLGDGRRLFTLDYGACIFCGRCAAACTRTAVTIEGDFALATLRRADLVYEVEVQYTAQATP